MSDTSFDTIGAVDELTILLYRSELHWEWRLTSINRTLDSGTAVDYNDACSAALQSFARHEPLYG